MRACLLLLLATSCFAAGKLELFYAPRGAEVQPVQGSWDLGSTAVSDTASAIFRIRNTGDEAVMLSVLELAGAGFSFTGAPSRPYLIAPGINVDFTVRFRPTDYGAYSGNLRINSANNLL